MCSCALLLYVQQGKLSLDFVTFRGSELVSPRDHEALVLELQKQVSDVDRLSLLRMVLQGSADTAVFFDWCVPLMTMCCCCTSVAAVG